MCWRDAYFYEACDHIIPIQSYTTCSGYDSQTRTPRPINPSRLPECFHFDNFNIVRNLVGRCGDCSVDTRIAPAPNDTRRAAPSSSTAGPRPYAQLAPAPRHDYTWPRHYGPASGSRSPPRPHPNWTEADNRSVAMREYLRDRSEASTRSYVHYDEYARPAEVQPTRDIGTADPDEVRDEWVRRAREERGLTTWQALNDWEYVYRAWADRRDRTQRVPGRSPVPTGPYTEASSARSPGS